MTSPPVDNHIEQASYNRQVGLAIGLTAGMMVLVSFVIGIVASTAPSEDTRTISSGATAAELDRLRDRQITELTTTDWIDPNQDRLRIPVERAIDKLSEELLESDYAEPKFQEGQTANDKLPSLPTAEGR